MRSIVLALMLAAAAFGQYKAEPAGAPPADLAPSVSQLLQKEGTKISSDKGVFAEVWLRAATPAGSTAKEDNVTLPEVPHGALLGVVRFPAQAADRRGQTIKPGVYTLRYSMFPQNGDHQGVAPQRDFLVLVPAADDKDGAATPGFEPLMGMGRKATGTPHPGVLSMWKADTDFKAGFDKMGDHDWVLQGKMGETPVAIILIGKAEG